MAPTRHLLAADWASEFDEATGESIARCARFARRLDTAEGSRFVVDRLLENHPEQVRAAAQALCRP